MEDKHLEHNCECGCGCDHDHDHSTMKLQLEDGSQVECTVIDIFGVEGYEDEYIALLPMDSDEVLIYKYIEYDDESFELLNIETDEEFEAVEGAFFDGIDETDLFDEDEEFIYEDDEDEEE